MHIMLIPAAWDVLSFLGNAKHFAQIAGGALLMLLGTAALVWGGVLLVKRQMTPRKGDGAPISLVQVIGLILVGGALATGGFHLVSTVGSGGQTTITQLGNGG